MLANSPCPVYLNSTVRNLRFFISTVLLLTFAFTLGEETFGASEHYLLICQSEFANSSQSGLDDFASQQNCSEQGQERHSQKCSDPCHFGQSHFGHLSFFAANSVLSYPDITLFLSKFFFSQSMIEGPTLEGPRRPPRLA